MTERLSLSAYYTFLEGHELAVSYKDNAAVVRFSQAEKGSFVLCFMESSENC